jgi:hypothetical protein
LEIRATISSIITVMEIGFFGVTRTLRDVIGLFKGF